MGVLNEYLIAYAVRLRPARHARSGEEVSRMMRKRAGLPMHKHVPAYYLRHDAVPPLKAEVGSIWQDPESRVWYVLEETGHVYVDRTIHISMTWMPLHIEVT